MKGIYRNGSYMRGKSLSTMTVHYISDHHHKTFCGAGRNGVVGVTRRRDSYYMQTSKCITCTRCIQKTHEQGYSLPQPEVRKHIHYGYFVTLSYQHGSLEIKYNPRTKQYYGGLTSHKNNLSVTIEGEGLHLSEIRIKLLEAYQRKVEQHEQ